MIAISRARPAGPPTGCLLYTSIRNGVRKVNVDTDNRLAITGAIRKVLWTQPEKFDPRDYMKPARAAMQQVVAQRMTQFGQAGHAGDYTAISIPDMAKGYKNGTLTTLSLIHI